MQSQEDLRKSVMAQAQGAMALNLAFIGIANGLFDAIKRAGSVPYEELAAAAKLDPGYVQRWCEAAYGFGYLEVVGDKFSVSPLGDAFRPDAPGTLMPFAVQSVLGAHMAERTAAFMKTGERPGERVLEECASVLPWFGPMLEANFSTFFEREIMPAIPAYERVGSLGGVVLDLGCGNGWYLRRLVAKYPKLGGIGVDGFEQNIQIAREKGESDGLSRQLMFRAGSIYGHDVSAKFAMVAMNRSLHHVWDQRERVFRILHDTLHPGGCAVIWEPRWPDTIDALRTPKLRALAFQNLNEHVQGNHFLRPEEIETAFHEVGMETETFLFGEGSEAVVVGTRKA